MNPQQRRKLKQACHDLKPIVWVGQNGLTENVINEINLALDVHELIKIKIAAGDKTEKTQIASDICEQTQSEPIQLIGNMHSVYRKNQNLKK